MSQSLKAAVLVNRHGLHSANRKLLDAVQAEELRIPYVFNNPHSGSLAKFKYLVNWIYGALNMRRFKKYDIVMFHAFQYEPAIMDWIGRKPKKPVWIMLHAGEQLYNLEKGLYGKVNTWLMRRSLLACDVNFCTGRLQTEYMQRQDPLGKTVIVRADVTTVSDARYAELEALRPDLNAHALLLIGDIYSNWRLRYKGFDLAARAMPLLRRQFPEVSLRAVGITDFASVAQELAKLPSEARAAIVTEGPERDIAKLYGNHPVLLLPGRGDAFPNTVLEAMAAGQVPIVSADTGNCDVVAEIHPNLVCGLSPESLAECIGWFFGLPLPEKQALSDKARQVVQQYREAHGRKRFVAGVAEAYRLVQIFRKC